MPDENTQPQPAPPSYQPEHAEPPATWKPKISDKVRTIGYFIGLGLTCIAAVIALKDDPANALLTVGGLITGGLGVVYNPISLNKKQG
ncbi:hypothetical protein OZX72_03060 [Bifidobacterium sp. ESL0769]|uniref:hypothetical protein n=1 Tax=Bifidobacterium sp. ESL0769 TaxID=2983229 RepID=UPI0023F82A29|nr:hypothetical protein [Bifidobacterium sp. ESL0769]WEV67977.1 hypothetical protein OZX72_03060 [Bifidobacterium sp. ESL0769]